jgi:hypothetical protein
MDPSHPQFPKRLRATWILLAWSLGAVAQPNQKPWTPNIPKVWDEEALADWATPVAGLNVRPTHISSKEYYSLAIENLRTYPVYYPGREPEGYWEMLQNVGPQPLIEPEKLKTESEWVAAGQRVFEELDDFHLRTFDPKLIAAARSREAVLGSSAPPPAGRIPPDGITADLRWVPTKEGVALSMVNCRGCHLQYRPDGVRVPGAPGFGGLRSSLQLRFPSRVISGEPPFHFGPELRGGTFNSAWLYQAYGVPWIKDDVNERVQVLTEAEYRALLDAAFRAGASPRWNGSLYYPSKVPDLMGIKDRRYLDNTATHLHRGIGDLMRYAAQVSFAEMADFGPYHMLSPDTKRVQARLPDEALYALALYIYSLKPPPNPNPFDERAKAGQKIFVRENCSTCHTHPLYTNNKLTLAEGFIAPNNRPATLDVLTISVHTDSGLALKTRKGTGYYKIPSLKGVWYRGHFLHDGSAASLEEIFDPARLDDRHVPGGWLPPGLKTRAIKGHEFGLKLNPAEREQLIAFLRTL